MTEADPTPIKRICSKELTVKTYLQRVVHYSLVRNGEIPEANEILVNRELNNDIMVI